VRIRTRLLPGVAAAALLLAACDATDDGLDPGQEDGVEEVDTDATDATDEDDDGLDDPETDDLTDDGMERDGDLDADADDQTAGEVTIETAESDAGTHLVDGEGHAVYLSVLDGEDESTCTGDCAQLWHPVVVDGEPEAGEGVDEDLLGTFEREDGDTQVTYDGMPLYRFVADHEPGDTNGHELADRWYLVDVDGGALGGAEITGPPVEEDPEADAEGDEDDEDDDS
jgi:predicted lipoprotein with Yx(FWY)xxD motif